MELSDYRLVCTHLAALNSSPGLMAVADAALTNLHGWHPEVRSMFPGSRANQCRVVAVTLAEACRAMRSQESLTRVMHRVGASAAHRGASHEHTLSMAMALYEVLRTFAGTQWNAELGGAWCEALENCLHAAGFPAQGALRAETINGGRMAKAA